MVERGAKAMLRGSGGRWELVAARREAAWAVRPVAGLRAHGGDAEPLALLVVGQEPDGGPKVLVRGRAVAVVLHLHAQREECAFPQGRPFRRAQPDAQPVERV